MNIFLSDRTQVQGESKSHKKLDRFILEIFLAVFM
jgi:hypothetical protein